MFGDCHIIDQRCIACPDTELGARIYVNAVHTDSELGNDLQIFCFFEQISAEYAFARYQGIAFCQQFMIYRTAAIDDFKACFRKQTVYELPSGCIEINKLFHLLPPDMFRLCFGRSVFPKGKNQKIQH